MWIGLPANIKKSKFLCIKKLQRYPTSVFERFVGIIPFTYPVFQRFVKVSPIANRVFERFCRVFDFLSWFLASPAQYLAPLVSFNLNQVVFCFSPLSFHLNLFRNSDYQMG
jgi:hypothetical protein